MTATHAHQQKGGTTHRRAARRSPRLGANAWKRLFDAKPAFSETKKVEREVKEARKAELHKQKEAKAEVCHS